MTESIFETVKASVTMSQVAEMCGYKPDRAGRILCPFHHEKTPSMKIYGGNRGFYCYGCQTGGDVIKFTQKVFDCSALEAAKRIADHFGIRYEGSSVTLRRREKTEAEKRRDEVRRIEAFVNGVNRAPLPVDEDDAALYGRLLGRRDYYEYYLREEAQT